MPSGEYDPAAVESHWQEAWVDDATYAYPDEDATPASAFSIDTPPPTVSGDLHWGHVYGSILQDVVARFERMRGRDVFFPFGYDDNGIASERLTERELGINHGDYSRREFQEKCREVCREYEDLFTEKMQSLGLSIDWDNTYKTIEPRVQRISQLSFLDLYDQGREYRQQAPAIWCPDCETAISQVEIEDEEREGHFHDIAFELVEPGSDPPADPEGEGAYPVPTDPGDEIVISTTRPELLPACVAMFVHPEDEANAHLVGGTARVPLFDHEVPIFADDRVDRETGSGIVMSCTFGDQTDIEWYQAYDLPLRIAIDESGTMTDRAGEYAGLSTEAAREAIVEDLEAAGALLDREAITHTVRVHERSCDAAIEFLVTEQWYIKLLDKTDEYLEAGAEIDWYPEKMFTRYRHWIEGLEWDWCISRQRDSGVPFPVWYCADCDELILADREDLPVEPIADEPPVARCPSCGHDTFEPEEDVFDTWATSSLTPLINARWDWDSDQAAFSMDRPEIYPMDVRPQGHDIISFWLFHTVVKCYEHTGEVPFETAMINGMVLDENREAMSKSKGNIVAPDEVLAQFPVDAARYWAAGSAIGDDLPYQVKGLRAGERLLHKLWNASKLVERLAPEPDPDRPDTLREIDRWLLAEVDALTETVTAHLEEREFAKAREALRTTFWNTFCDDYLEVAKQREDAAVAYTVRTAHRRFLKLFAPLVAHITEELWDDMYVSDADHLGTASIHRSTWPEPLGISADREAGETAMAVVSALRKYKTAHELPPTAPLASVTVYGDIEAFADDIASVMHVDEFTVESDTAAPIETVTTDVDLAYDLVGPAFGERVSAIEAAIEAGEYELVDGQLHAAGEVLEAEMFELERQQRYEGAGTLLDAEGVPVIVRE